MQPECGCIFSIEKDDINIIMLSLLAERMGFEPMRDLHLLAVFETAPFNHLGTSPRGDYYITNNFV